MLETMAFYQTGQLIILDRHNFDLHVFEPHGTKVIKLEGQRYGQCLKDPRWGWFCTYENI